MSDHGGHTYNEHDDYVASEDEYGRGSYRDYPRRRYSYDDTQFEHGEDGYYEKERPTGQRRESQARSNTLNPRSDTIRKVALAVGVAGVAFGAWHLWKAREEAERERREQERQMRRRRRREFARAKESRRRRERDEESDGLESEDDDDSRRMPKRITYAPSDDPPEQASSRARQRVERYDSRDNDYGVRRVTSRDYDNSRRSKSWHGGSS